MKDSKHLRALVTLMAAFCILFSMCGTLSANSIIIKSQFYAEFINTGDDSRFYALLLAKSTDGRAITLVSHMSNKTEAQYERLREHQEQAVELGVQGYEADGVDTFLAQCDCLDGFVYDDEMTALECCFGDTVIEATYVTPIDNCNFRFLFYWPDTGEYKLSDTFSLEKINRIRIDMSADGTYLPITDLEYEYDLNALIPGVAFHLLFTLITETLIAVFFKLRTKKLLATILVTNLITNLTANLVAVLRVMHYVQLYFVIELAVFIVEFIVYRIFFAEEIKTSKILVFTAAANLFSAIGGFFAFLAVLSIVGTT